MEPLKEQMNDIKGRILNELGVLQETDMKDRKTLKINVTKKLKKNCIRRCCTGNDNTRN